MDILRRKKRLCIYVAYDKEGIIDSYIGYMLKELKTCMDCLVVIYNGEQVIKGKGILEKYADRLFFRKNIGLDAGAFKDTLCNILGWDLIGGYEELFLINDSFFGPFRPMESILLEMDGKDVDFWGLAKHGKHQNDSFGYCPEHLQSFFLAIRRRMLHSGIFQEYWENLPYFTTWTEVVKKHEMFFTQYFARQGFTYGTLADNDANDSPVMENNYLQYQALPYELIQKRNFPFLKRKPLEANILDMQTQEGFQKALDYIRIHTHYDVNHIYCHIIRTMNTADLYRNLHLAFIAPSQDSGSIDAGRGKAFIAVFAKSDEAVEMVSEYLEKIDKDKAQIRIYTETETVFMAYKRLGYSCRLSGFAEQWREEFQKLCANDYVCVIHDSDMLLEKGPNCIGKSFFYNIWENLLKDCSHMEYVMKCFDDDARLGFLAPPNPVFSDYFGGIGSVWKRKFCQIREVADRQRLQCRMSFNKLPVAVTDNFWIRGKILEKFLTKRNIDRSLLRFLWTYVVQDAGYYSGIVESNEYAAMNHVNQQYYLESVVNKIQLQYGDFTDFTELKKFVFQGAIRDYCWRYSPIFIYGTGYMARKYKDFIPECQAYIVSDGQPKPDEVNGISVVYLSEAEFTANTGVVVCLDEKNQAQVIPMLEKRGIFHYLCI